MHWWKSTIVMLMGAARVYGCKGPAEVGHGRCGSPDAGMKYYYNITIHACLAFYYEGCGGNAVNRFEDHYKCENACNGYTNRRPCALDGEMYVTEAGDPVMDIHCTASVAKRCPSTHKCTMKDYGVCCPRDIEDADSSRYDNGCASRFPGEVRADGKLYTELHNFVAYVGKSCESLNCRDGFRCVQANSYFFKCCLNYTDLQSTEYTPKQGENCSYGCYEIQSPDQAQRFCHCEDIFVEDAPGGALSPCVELNDCEEWKQRNQSTGCFICTKYTGDTKGTEGNKIQIWLPVAVAAAVFLVLVGIFAAILLARKRKAKRNDTAKGHVKFTPDSKEQIS